MDNFQDAHFFKLPTQGNVYLSTNLHQTNGTNKVLVAILKRKVFCCELLSNNEGELRPLVKEIPFTYIPAGAEIISLDAFNRSNVRDEFFIGITIIKISSDLTETYLNVYTEQEIEERGELNLDGIAQSCVMIELTFTPYHLIHTYLITPDNSKEVVWLLSGSDLKIHLFREDPQNHTYGEVEIDVAFPECISFSSVVLWLDIKHTDDFKRRITGIGCECGLMKCSVVDTLSGIILQTLSEQYDSPVSRTLIFSLANELYPPSFMISGSGDLSNIIDNKITFHLVVLPALQPAHVYMNIVENGLSEVHQLSDSDKYDATLCACVADINMDSEFELLIGTYAQAVLVYKFAETWNLTKIVKFPHAPHSILYVDITGDGVNELLVITVSGIHIFQHNPAKVFALFNERLKYYENEAHFNLENKDDLS